MASKGESKPLFSLLNTLFSDPKGSEADAGNTAFGGQDPTEPSMRERMERKRRNEAVRNRELNQLRLLLRQGKNAVATRPLPIVQSGAYVHDGKAPRPGSRLEQVPGAEVQLDAWWGSSPDTGPLPGSRAGAFATQPQSIASKPPQAPVQAPPLERIPAYSRLDLCVRKAALHFAQAAFPAAQVVLSTMRKDSSLDPDAAALLSTCLLEVYRGSGQQENFEQEALDFAQRFGQSAIEWFDIPDGGPTGAAAPLGPLATPASSPTSLGWVCPPYLDAEALTQCRLFTAKLLASGSTICAIDWRGLQQIDPYIADAFSTLIREWSTRPFVLQWIGAPLLLASVDSCKTESALASEWWLITLDLLCLMQEPTAFENAALQYCVQFEVSPPSWRAVSSTWVPGPRQMGAAPSHTAFPSDLLPTVPVGIGPLDDSYCLIRLEGNLIAPDSMTPLMAAPETARQITVACERLGRVDLARRQELKDWLQKCQARHCTVSFTHLPQLVLTLFQMAGLASFASLSTGSH